MPPKVLFLTLRIFSTTGGIEKVCRLIGKAFCELGMQYGWKTNVYSMYGKKHSADTNRYFPQTMFSGFSGNKVWFVLKSIFTGRQTNYVLMSHINLLMVGFLIKVFKPSVKLVLLAHGIEVWKTMGAVKKKMIAKCDLILPVSHFTKEKMMELYGLPEEKFTVINNCLDPFLEGPLCKQKSERLLSQYGLLEENCILLTVTRIAATEQYKGYDKVLQALPDLVKSFPGIRYLLVGKYDALEKDRLDKMIVELKLDKVVIFAGFVADEELADHFNLADIFIMPSEKEGFGIVFIEAMFYGKPVIAGDSDGSTDALCNGEFGLLVDPNNPKEIGASIIKVMGDKQHFVPQMDKLLAKFSYQFYKEKLRITLEGL